MKITIIFAISICLASVELLGPASATSYHTQVGNVACNWVRTDTHTYNNWKMCMTPIQPQFVPNQPFSKVFNVMVYIKEYESTYFGGIKFHALSLGDWPIRSLDAISHVEGKLYIKARDGQWMKKGEFGPLWMRRTNDPAEDYRMYTKLPGFVSYDAQSGWATFRFFINDPTDSDTTITDWKTAQSAKTSYELGVSLGATCMDGFYTNLTTEATKPERCLPADTPSSNVFMNNYLMKSASPMTGTVENATLKNATLDFVYNWSDDDIDLYTKDRVTGAADGKPQLKVLLFDSNPGPHGQDGLESKDQKNVRVRAVLGSFTYFLTWNDTYDEIEDTFSLPLSSGGFQEEQLSGFLFKYAANDHQGIDSAYYSGWNPQTGLSMAVSVCMKTGAITDRDAACRQWQISPVTIAERALPSTS